MAVLIAQATNRALAQAPSRWRQRQHPQPAWLSPAAGGHCPPGIFLILYNTSQHGALPKPAPAVSNVGCSGTQNRAPLLPQKGAALSLDRHWISKPALSDVLSCSHRALSAHLLSLSCVCSRNVQQQQQQRGRCVCCLLLPWPASMLPKHAGPSTEAWLLL